MNYHAVHYNTRPFGLLSFFLQNLNQFSNASCKSVFYVNIGFPLKASRRSHKNYCNLKFASQKIFCAQVDCCTPFLPFNHCYKKVLVTNVKTLAQSHFLLCQALITAFAFLGYYEGLWLIDEERYCFIFFQLDF